MESILKSMDRRLELLKSMESTMNCRLVIKINGLHHKSMDRRLINKSIESTINCRMITNIDGIHNKIDGIHNGSRIIIRIHGIHNGQ